MHTKYWASHGWIYLHAVTVNYPENPTQEDKTRVKNFFLNLTLPCDDCQGKYATHINNNPITDEVVDSRANLVKWLILIHNEVNKSLGSPEVPYNDVIKKFKKQYDIDISKLLNNESIKIKNIVPNNIPTKKNMRGYINQSLSSSNRRPATLQNRNVYSPQASNLLNNNKIRQANSIQRSNFASQRSSSASQRSSSASQQNNFASQRSSFASQRSSFTSQRSAVVAAPRAHVPQRSLVNPSRVATAPPRAGGCGCGR
ncbi:MAG: disulfide thiol oxidoreductase, Erv1 / Alr family [Edafosvirus sp.]|uniref:Sulfhydryl oxidase n=1 Tax=Edafosvirus sp. TaxID=2487765 RepID=A0A3G4ZWG5_9VIRU|nr:MAG: disulfide thiol oxidoreductase, Erv1 / Alr family [Edafosvirus sp.]